MTTVDLSLQGAVLARLQDGTRIEPHLSPRPYLHPVRTTGGTVVTEESPGDHRHHVGVSAAVPDVSGVSFWGGTTFTRDRGPVLLDNHGRQSHVSWTVREPDHHVEVLSWTGPGGDELLREERTTRALPLDERTWVLDLRVRLTNTSGRDLSVGSPATNGRPGAGYGGLFWRAPISPTPPTCTGAGGLDGEKALHGSRAPWLAMAGSTADGAPWTLVLLQPGPRTDPWFLRAEEYPGVGPALAWDTRLPVPEGATLERRLRTAVHDGHTTGPGDLARRALDLA
ncbi:PmoA family protein [Nocardiopsis sp. NPDC050513]|uniref:PmoA family protein n=1 Tax=Nocardiopsis sp. NPDC050513 TaxID=3364338 RepID=UPI0037AF5BF0